jgi:hypothetical protein
VTAADLEAEFPNLRVTGYTITSPVDPTYNCIAWAAGDDEAFWWPVPGLTGAGYLGGYYWPQGVPVATTMEAFELAFKRQGYRACPDGELEPGFEKIVIYADTAGKPTHASRQLPDGRWASKLGKLEDIEHQAVEGLSGSNYGEAHLYMRRKIRPQQPDPKLRNAAP